MKTYTILSLTAVTTLAVLLALDKADNREQHPLEPHQELYDVGIDITETKMAGHRVFLVLYRRNGGVDIEHIEEECDKCNDNLK